MKRLMYTLFAALTLTLSVVQAQTIVDVAVNNPDFSTLVSALEAAGLVGALQTEGPFTVFAPTNDAFAALPAGELEALLANPDALAEVLLYHVVPGNFSTDRITADMTGFSTLQGETLAITGAGVGEANVVAVDIVASNGVIQVIDRVLLPPVAMATMPDISVAETPTVEAPVVEAPVIQAPVVEAPVTTVTPAVSISLDEVPRTEVGLIDLAAIDRRGNVPSLLGTMRVSSQAVPIVPATAPAMTRPAMAVSASSVETVSNTSATRSLRYGLAPVGGSNVRGSVLVSDYDSTTVVVIAVSGTPVDGDHPAHFHAGNCGSGGSIVVPLNNVRGATGFSVTTTDAPFDAIVQGDHYLNIHLSQANMATIVACGEVGAGVR